MKDKTLGTLVLSLALGLGNTGCDKGNEPQPIQRQDKNISGKIISIDEDSFAIAVSHGGTNFEFEHFRIQAPDGRIYLLVFSGPSNYQVGDAVDFQYRAQSWVSERDLLSAGECSGTSMQKFYFNADGLILR